MLNFFAQMIDHLPSWGPEMLVAAGQTLTMTGATFILAMLLGVLVALLRVSPLAPLRWGAIAFIEIGRGTPALVILFVIYFGLPAVAPALSFDSFWAAVLGLGLQGGAILGEVFRSGIEAIDRGQREASL
ncbi:MAG TPA: ABC transporter permease subunit, partial [Nordella sp.]|nr:ABC transporter permease subunit [Nordella sp.]